MKSLLSIKITGIILFMSLFTAPAVLAHEPEKFKESQKVEQFWVQNGIPAYFKKLKEEKKMSDRQLSLFLGKHVSVFSADKRTFFRQIDLNGNIDQQLANSLIVLKERASDYDSMLLEFEEVPEESILETSGSSSILSAVTDCDNVGFSSGNTNNWTLRAGVASATGNNAFGTGTYSALNTAGLTALHNTGFDENVASLPKVAAPGDYALRLENLVSGGNAFQAEYEFVAESDQPYFVYKYAVVLEEPSNPHPDAAKPFFRINMYAKVAGVYQEIECARYFVVANSSTPELKNNFIKVSPEGSIYYKPWTTIAIPLEDYLGLDIKVVFTASDCAWGGHLGYAYIDASCLDLTPVVGSCLPDGTRKITAPEGFINYWWQGSGIVSNNLGREITVNKAGKFTALLIAENNSNGCPVSIEVDITACPQPPVTLCNISGMTANPQSCNSTNGTYSLTGTIQFTDPPQSGVLLLSVGAATYTYTAPFSSPLNYTLNYLYADGKAYQVKATFYPDAFVSSGQAQCTAVANYTAPQPCNSLSMNCADCIYGFKPEVGRTYVISAWVKDPTAAADAENLTDPYIQVGFNGSSTLFGPFKGSGKIIDGWQRIYAEFTVPSGAVDITIILGTGTHVVHFDDIRIHPKDGSYASYVYDPVTLKLVATLDNNNYATFYEYDKEGALIRVKKETERGIMTIQENRNNQPKR
jgi:hypothetical protein